MKPSESVSELLVIVTCCCFLTFLAIFEELTAVSAAVHSNVFLRFLAIDEM